MTQKHTHTFENLLREYALNTPNYNLLLFIQERGEAMWPEIRDAEISLSTGNALRALVDLQYLNGPQRHQDKSLEPIGSKPFSLSKRGEEIMTRIKKGLHKPYWVSSSPHRIHALKILVEVRSLTTDERNKRKVKMNSLDSLVQHKYASFNNNTWHITDVGEEAWREYQDQKKTKPLV